MCFFEHSLKDSSLISWLCIKFGFFLQAACGVTVTPKPQIVNIDAADVNDELAVVEYIDDIYQFYKLEEVLFTLISASPS